MLAIWLIIFSILNFNYKTIKKSQGLYFSFFHIGLETTLITRGDFIDVGLDTVDLIRALIARDIGGMLLISGSLLLSGDDILKSIKKIKESSNLADALKRLNSIEDSTRALYGFKEADSHYNFSKLDNLDKISDFVKSGVFPIAGTVFGGYVVIGIDDNYGKVMFVYHDRPGNPKELADDFATFVSKCKSEKVGRVESIEERRARLIANGKTDEWCDGLVYL